MRIDTYEKFQEMERQLEGVHAPDEYNDLLEKMETPFYREFTFKTVDGDAVFLWYTNNCTLVLPNLEIWFYGAEINNCFPARGWQKSLSLKNANGDTIGAVCLEKSS